jgi:site-specific DNA-cytosine methylase
MKNTNQKFGTLVATLQAMVETGNFSLDIQRHLTSTGYRVGSVELALQQQVTEQMVHNLDDADTTQPQRRIQIQIIGLDSETTIERKIEIAKEMWDGTFVPPMPSDRLKNSDNVLECLDGYFGEGIRLDQQFIDEQNKVEEVEDESPKQIQDELLGQDLGEQITEADGNEPDTSGEYGHYSYDTDDNN